MTPRGAGTTAAAAARIDQGAGGAGPGLGPERAIPRCARSFRIACNAGTPEHRSSSVGRVKSRQLFIAGHRRRPRLAADAVAISPPSVAARSDVPSGSGRRSMPTAVRAQGRRASAPSRLAAAAPAPLRVALAVGGALATQTAETLLPLGKAPARRKTGRLKWSRRTVIDRDPLPPRGV
jgi:hypothetical protein